MNSTLKRFHVYLYGPKGEGLLSSFEDAASRLQQLPQLYFELDGSFVWSPDRAQQIDGMLYDAQGRLQYVDLQGQCSFESWDAVIGAINDSRTATDCFVMVIPTRELKNLPTFEHSIWGSQN